MNWQTWSPDIPGQGCVPPENISHRVTANAQTSDADENLLLVRHSGASLNNSDRQHQRLSREDRLNHDDSQRHHKQDGIVTVVTCVSDSIVTCTATMSLQEWLHRHSHYDCIVITMSSQVQRLYVSCHTCSVTPSSQVWRQCHYKNDYIVTVIMTPLSSQCHHRYNDYMSVVIPVTIPSQVWRLYTCNSVVTWTTTSPQIPRLRTLLCSSVLTHQYTNSWTWENN